MPFRIAYFFRHGYSGGLGSRTLANPCKVNNNATVPSIFKPMLLLLNPKQNNRVKNPMIETMNAVMRLPCLVRLIEEV